VRRRREILVLGMMSRIPVPGVFWQTVHYLVGLRRLGFDVYYVEAHARTPSSLMDAKGDDGSARAAAVVDRVMRRFGLGRRWAYHALHDDGRCFGLQLSEVRRLYNDAELVLNLHGGTVPSAGQFDRDRLVYLETDPVDIQLEVHERRAQTLEFLSLHGAHFTFGENYGRVGCRLPVSTDFDFRPTRQPVVLDFWSGRAHETRPVFTTVGNWRQPWRDVTFGGEVYSWSKDTEFAKILGLPRRTAARFELALSSFTSDDRALLEREGWGVRDAKELPDLDTYRSYVATSLGEFSAAKDQNVRLRSGWFSDRSATYLAAGRPVVAQETGFSSVLPTGQGLFAYSSEDDAVNAVERVLADYRRHSRWARELARSEFASDVVLSRVLADVGVSLRRPRRPRRDAAILPLGRRPTTLPEETVTAALRAPLPRSVKRDGQPSESVVVVTYDNLAFTRLCVESVLECSPGTAELVVVDNGSTDGSLDYLQELARRRSHVRTIANASNRGFAAATNQGLAAARGDVLVVLNNDTIVTPCWLERLSRHVEDERVGLVGPLTNKAGNEAEIETAYETWDELVEFAATVEGALRDVPVVTMFCAALRRTTFERLGPLDERYGVGLFEDDDYSRAARAAGFRVVLAEDVFVHHFGEASFGALFEHGERGELFRRNRALYESKWHERWEPHARRNRSGYERLVERVRAAASAALPEGSTIVVASKGDDRLLELGARTALHFPADERGRWAGRHPADDAEAERLVDAARARGARYLLIPQPQLWWLDHYDGLRRRLDSGAGPIVLGNGDAVLFELSAGKGEEEHERQRAAA
jgi:GT2 family glycosyltransferase